MNISLVDLCLSTIVDNFAKLNNDFKKTKDDYKKREFEFLQRKYSFELLNRLSEKDDLPEEYIDLLVNKYLKFLDTNWFKSCKWDKVTSKFAEIGHNIEKIFMRRRWYKNVPTNSSDQDLICYLPNLKSFKDNGTCFSSLLENVAKFCCNIEEIYIMSSFLTNDIKYLCTDKNEKALCTNLNILHFESVYIKQDDLKYLVKNLPSLEILDSVELREALNSLHKNDLSRLDNLKSYNSTGLCVVNPEFDEVFVTICMSVCPDLNRLQCEVRNEQYSDYLSRYLPELDKLYITIYKEFNVNNVLKSKGRKLTSLKLDNCSVSDSVLANCCPILKRLRLLDVCVLSEEDDSSFEFNSLSQLTIQTHRVLGDIGINYRSLLSQSKHLKTLAFIRTDLSSSEMESCLLRCSERNPIETLYFCRSLIYKEFLKKILLNCHSLKNIKLYEDLNDSEIDDLSEFLKAMPSKPKFVITKV